MEDRIPIRSDRSLLLGRQTSKWSLCDVVFHENNSNSVSFPPLVATSLKMSYLTHILSFGPFIELHSLSSVCRDDETKQQHFAVW